MSVKLSWLYYCELLTISDTNKRSFYEKEMINSRWSIQELNGTRTLNEQPMRPIFVRKTYNEEEVEQLIQNHVSYTN